MNLAPLLATALDASVMPADDAALSIWREQWDQGTDRFGGFWRVDDAVDWIRETPALSRLFRVQSFDGLIESGAGLARVTVDSAGSGWLPFGDGDRDWRFWDEAVELRGGGFLSYPNDAESTPALSFYAPVVHGDGPASEPIRLATLVFELVQPRVVSRVRLRDDADGRCARYLVTSDRGDRELSCEPLSCPGDCERRTWVRPGGIRRARCAC